jgi:hypothetical protein
VKLLRVLFSRHSLLALLALPALAAGCGVSNEPGDEPTLAPTLTPATVAGCGVTLDQVALYQGVEVVLGRREGGVPQRHVDVIADRPALVRAFVSPSVAGVAVSARLTLETPAGVRTYDAARTLASASTAGDLDSTLNFAVPAGDLSGEASLSLALSAPALCPGGPAARFPDAGALALRPLRTGTLKIRLVPVRYDSDGSGRLPDTSPEQLERFRSLLQAMFPVAGVQLDVRAPVGTSIDVSEQKGWSALLESLRDLRARDAPPADLYYYGLVEPAPSNGAYCLGSCIGGISYVAGPSDPGVRVGVGVGFPGLVTAESLAHELGHAHGRPHAPCGPVNQPDPGYPYAAAAAGGWGLDGRDAGKLEPPDSKDLMSYCSPRWISDYTFGAIALRSAQVNGAIPQALVASEAPGGSAGRWRVMLIDGAGQARWGLEAAGAPPGSPVSAEELDDAGVVRGAIQVWRAPLGGGDDTAYWVPLPATSGGAIRIPGATALSFNAAPSVPPLNP